MTKHTNMICISQEDTTQEEELLHEHSKTHGEKEENTCTDCNISFKTKNELTEHTKIAHELPTNSNYSILFQRKHN